MAQVISLEERRERQMAEAHARAMVLFECATQLARQAHPGLMSLIDQSYGPGWVEDRVRDTITPRRMDSAEQHVRAKRRPAR